MSGSEFTSGWRWYIFVWKYFRQAYLYIFLLQYEYFICLALLFYDNIEILIKKEGENDGFQWKAFASTTDIYKFLFNRVKWKGLEQNLVLFIVWR